MEAHDDDLRKFEADGGSPLPATNDQGYAEHDGLGSGTLVTGPAHL